MARYQDLARSTGVWLSLGGFQETGPDPDHIYNTHVILDAEGAVVSSYRKVCTCWLELISKKDPLTPMA